MSEKEISFQKRGEESEYRSYRRDCRYGPNHEILVDYNVLDAEGKWLGKIQENPTKSLEHSGLWSLWFGFPESKEVYCYPELLRSLEEAQKLAKELAGKSLEELNKFNPEVAVWAL